MKKYLSDLWARWCRSSQMVGEAFDVPEVAPKPAMIVCKVMFSEPKPTSEVRKEVTFL